MIIVLGRHFTFYGRLVLHPTLNAGATLSCVLAKLSVRRQSTYLI